MAKKKRNNRNFAKGNTNGNKSVQNTELIEIDEKELESQLQIEAEPQAEVESQVENVSHELIDNDRLSSDEEMLKDYVSNLSEEDLDKLSCVVEDYVEKKTEEDIVEEDIVEEDIAEEDIVEEKIVEEIEVEEVLIVENVQADVEYETTEQTVEVDKEIIIDDNIKTEEDGCWVDEEHQEDVKSTDKVLKSVMDEELEALLKEDSNEDYKETRYKNDNFEAEDLDNNVKKTKKKRKILVFIFVLLLIGSLVYASIYTGITPKYILEQLKQATEYEEKDAANLDELETVTVATINGKTYTEKDLAEYNKIHRYNFLDNMVAYVLLEQYGASLGITVSEVELNTKVNELMESYSSNEAFEKSIYEGRTTIEGFKANVKSNMLRDKIILKLRDSIKVSDEEAQKYYEKSKDYLDYMNIKYVILNKDGSAEELRKKVSESKDINIVLKLFEDNEGNVFEQKGITKYDTLFGSDFMDAQKNDVLIKNSTTSDNLIIGLVTDKVTDFETMKNIIKETIKDYKKYELYEQELSKFRENSDIKYLEVK